MLLTCGTTGGTVAKPKWVVPGDGVATNVMIDPNAATVIDLAEYAVLESSPPAGPAVRPLAESVVEQLKRESRIGSDAGISLIGNEPPRLNTEWLTIPPAPAVAKPLRVTPPNNLPGGMPSPAEMPMGSAVGAGRYLIEKRLGCGGMGTVLQVFDQDLRRRVAMKVLKPVREHQRHQPGDDLLERFVEEAQVSSQLQHPNIMPVYDIGLAEGGFVYYTMKLVGGRSFQEILDCPRERPRAEDANRHTNGFSRMSAHRPKQSAPGHRAILHERLDIFAKIVSAVAYAHSKGVVHRDLKPENVLVGRFGEVLVMDWGLAKVIGKPRSIWPMCHVTAPVETVRSTQGRVTVTGMIAGTPAYMAPEQGRGEAASIDARTDVWALGAILYAILTGFPPHSWGSARFSLDELMRRVRDEPVRPPRQAAPFLPIPSTLDRIAQKALAFDPADRYATADDLLADLERVAAGEFDGPTGIVRRVIVSMGASWQVATTITLAVAACAVAVGLSL